MVSEPLNVESNASTPGDGLSEIHLPVCGLILSAVNRDFVIVIDRLPAPALFQ
jgi:hypothetical protein